MPIIDHAVLRHAATFSSLVLLLLAWVAMPACDSNVNPPTPDNVPEAYGHVEGRTYINDYFKLRLSVPEGWHLSNEESKEAMAELTDSILEKKKNTGMNAGKFRKSFIMMINEHPLGKTDQFNSGISVMVEHIGGFTDIQTAEDYVNKIRAGLSQHPHITFTPQNAMRPMGDKAFTGLMSTVDFNGFSYQQNAYVLQQGAYVLIFTLASDSDDGLGRLEGLLDQIETIE